MGRRRKKRRKKASYRQGGSPSYVTTAIGYTTQAAASKQAGSGSRSTGSLAATRHTAKATANVIAAGDSHIIDQLIASYRD